MRKYKCDPLMMGQRLKDLRRNAKNSMSQLEFAEEIGICLGNIHFDKSFYVALAVVHFEKISGIKIKGNHGVSDYNVISR